MEPLKSKLDGAGRLFIPTHYRNLLHLKPGEEVMLRLEQGELRVCSFKEAAHRARDRIAHYNKDNTDLLEMLFKLRREENLHD